MAKMKRHYDVALSFASEDRLYVEQVASALKAADVKVFYDAYEESSLWGKNLYTHLSDIYKNQAIYTIIFISKNYSKKLWTNHERESAQARAFEDNREYILPARFDNSDVPGVLRSVGYLDLSLKTPTQVCDLLIQKLNKVKSVQKKSRFIDMGTRDPFDKKLINPKIDKEYATINTRFWKSESRDHFENSVCIDPSQYTAVWELLNDLYYNVLYKYVSPMSYGSEWLLASQGFSKDILAPIEWIATPGLPVHQVKSDNWLATPPRQLGLIASSCWDVVDNPEIKNRNIITQSQGETLFKSANRYFLFATNREEMIKILKQHPKAAYILSHNGVIKSIDKSEFDRNTYKFKVIINDWSGDMGASEGNIWVDTGDDTEFLPGNSISQKMNRMFNK